MDTTEVASKLGTTPRLLRQFLRSDYSTFQAVGSGARYDFTDKDLPSLEKRFGEWRKDGKPRPNVDHQRVKVTQAPKSQPTVNKHERQQLADRLVWAEEGEVVMPDIRDPRVRARVKADAAAAEERLMMRLAAQGLHLFQLGDRTPA